MVNGKWTIHIHNLQFTIHKNNKFKINTRSKQKMADDYLTLTTFEPGTKAKAQEVNANFTALKTAVETKAAKEGSSTQAFLVANATSDYHAVNKNQLDNLSETLMEEFEKFSSRFCAHSGNTTNGTADLFTYTGLIITPKIGGTYAKLVISDYTGTQTTISTANNLNLTGYSEGTYNVFIKADSTITALKNTIYRQAKRPTMTVGDIWLDTSVEPINCFECTSTGDVKFLGVPIGQVVIASNAISSIKTFQYNKNGYNAANDKTNVDADNFSDAGKTKIVSWLMPDLANGVSKTANTTYTAEQDGWIYCEGVCWSDNILKINDVKIWHSHIANADNISGSIFTPIAKNSTYITTGNISNYTFFPMKEI